MDNEKNIVERFVNSDAEAFKLIFDFYIGKVNRFVQGYVKNKSDAADVTQTIFIKLWEKRSNVNIDKPFRAYLFSIAYTSVMDYFRKLETHIELGISEGLYNDTLSADGKTDDLLLYRQAVSIYEKALDLLPEKRRAIFIMSRHEGLSNKEIAERLGISIKTVENQMTSALASLKKEIAGLGLAVFIFFI